MNNVKRFPAGLDHQGRYPTRDTVGRQVAAEQAWAETCWQPTQQRRIPIKRSPRTLSRSTRAWIIVGCCAFAWLALLGLGTAVVGTGLLIAAMVAV